MDPVDIEIIDSSSPFKTKMTTGTIQEFACSTGSGTSALTQLSNDIPLIHWQLPVVSDDEDSAQTLTDESQKENNKYNVTRVCSGTASTSIDSVFPKPLEFQQAIYESGQMFTDPENTDPSFPRSNVHKGTSNYVSEDLYLTSDQFSEHENVKNAPDINKNVGVGNNIQIIENSLNQGTHDLLTNSIFCFDSNVEKSEEYKENNLEQYPIIKVNRSESVATCENISETIGENVGNRQKSKQKFGNRQGRKPIEHNHSKPVLRSSTKKNPRRESLETNYPKRKAKGPRNVKNQRQNKKEIKKNSEFREPIFKITEQQASKVKDTLRKSQIKLMDIQARIVDWEEGISEPIARENAWELLIQVQKECLRLNQTIVKDKEVNQVPKFLKETKVLANKYEQLYERIDRNIRECDEKYSMDMERYMPVQSFGEENSGEQNKSSEHQLCVSLESVLVVREPTETPTTFKSILKKPTDYYTPQKNQITFSDVSTNIYQDDYISQNKTKFCEVEEVQMSTECESAVPVSFSNDDSKPTHCNYENISKSHASTSTEIDQIKVNGQLLSVNPTCQIFPDTPVIISTSNIPTSKTPNLQPRPVTSDDLKLKQGPKESKTPEPLLPNVKRVVKCKSFSNFKKQKLMKPTERKVASISEPVNKSDYFDFKSNGDQNKKNAIREGSVTGEFLNSPESLSEVIQTTGVQELPEAITFEKSYSYDFKNDQRNDKSVDVASNVELITKKNQNLPNRTFHTTEQKLTQNFQNKEDITDTNLKTTKKSDFLDFKKDESVENASKVPLGAKVPKLPKSIIQFTSQEISNCIPSSLQYKEINEEQSINNEAILKSFNKNNPDFGSSGANLYRVPMIDKAENSPQSTFQTTELSQKNRSEQTKENNEELLIDQEIIDGLNNCPVPRDSINHKYVPTFQYCTHQFAQTSQNSKNQSVQTSPKSILSKSNTAIIAIRSNFYSKVKECTQNKYEQDESRSLTKAPECFEPDDERNTPKADDLIKGISCVRQKSNKEFFLLKDFSSLWKDENEIKKTVEW